MIISITKLRKSALQFDLALDTEVSDRRPDHDPDDNPPEPALALAA
jgi:hypothetical protein